MGTRADFYVGRDPESMEWLGSIAFDGYDIEDVGNAVSEEDYRERLAKFFVKRDHTTRPEQGWPWPWDNSGTTDCAYSFDEGQVWVGDCGRTWHPMGKLCPDRWEESELSPGQVLDTHDGLRVRWPDMSARKNVTLGRRSGLLVFGLADDDG